VRKTRRSWGRNAEFEVMNIWPTLEKSGDFHNGDELIAQKRKNFRSLLYGDFPELLQQVDSPQVSRQWDHPIDTTSPMKRPRLNKLSPTERAELNRRLKDAVEAGFWFDTFTVSSARHFFSCSQMMARFH
jgi:hypothetical protein